MQDYAKSVPVYIRETGSGYELVDTAEDAVLSTHDTIADARVEALEHLKLKPLVLHDEQGEPNGVWRWLIAASEESEPNPIDGVALAADNIWQLAGDVNTRRQAAPIDGGPQPDGLKPSDVHGLEDDSANPANGWAHAATVVVDEGGEANLHLYAELIPEVAPEVIRGRIAFGSVHFAHTEPDDDGRVELVRFISYALTNRPVDTRIAPSSGRSERALPCASTRSVRALHSVNPSREAEDPDMRKFIDEKARGAALEVLEEVAEIVNVDLDDELEGDAWASPIMEKIAVLKDAAIVEEITEGGGSGESEEARAVEGLSGAELDTFTEEILAGLRLVFGKPDAEPAELLSEFQASVDLLASAITTDPPEEDMSQQQSRETGDENDDEEARTLRAQLAAERKRAAAEKARADKLAAQAKAAKEKMAAERARAADEKWVREQIKKRGLERNEAGITRLVNICVRSGREAVEELLELTRAEPPSTAVLSNTRTGPAPGKPKATDARLVAQRAAVDAEEKRLRAELERMGKKIPQNIRITAAQRAMRQNPDAFRTRAVDPRA